MCITITVFTDMFYSLLLLLLLVWLDSRVWIGPITSGLFRVHLYRMRQYVNFSSMYIIQILQLAEIADFFIHHMFL